MGKDERTIFQIIRVAVAGVCWRLFFLAMGFSEEEYWYDIYYGCYSKDGEKMWEKKQ